MWSANRACTACNPIRVSCIQQNRYRWQHSRICCRNQKGEIGMTRLRVSLITVIALTFMLAVVPAPAAAARIFVRGGYWAGPAWGWGWGPGWYGPGYNYYYAPYDGTVKISSPDK